MTSWADVGHGKLKAKALRYINFPSVGLEENLLDLTRGYQFANFFVCAFFRLRDYFDKLYKPQKFYILMNKLACGPGRDDEALGQQDV